MAHKEVEWTHYEIECIVNSLFESLTRQPLLNNRFQCPKKIKGILTAVSEASDYPRTVSASCAERGYDWDNDDSYMTTGINGAHASFFSVKKGSDLWMNSKEITTKIVELSNNYIGWRCLFIKGTSEVITFDLHGGKYEWTAGYC